MEISVFPTPLRLEFHHFDRGTIVERDSRRNFGNGGIAVLQIDGYGHSRTQAFAR